MLTYIFVGLVALIAVFLVVVAMQPTEFSVSRAATMSASPSAVFEQVNDFHKWEAWSPWGKLDPQMKQTYEGAPAGMGAIYRWAGDKNVGEGGMTITESQPNDLIRIRLEFLKPFAATNTTEFTFRPEANGTLVTWTMSGTNNFIAKAIGLFMSMDSMIGGNFEQGLAAMKAIVEKEPGTQS